MGYNSQDSPAPAQVTDCYSFTGGPLVGYSTVMGNLVARCYGFGGPILTRNGSGTIAGCVLFSTPGGFNRIVEHVVSTAVEANCHVLGANEKPGQTFYEGLSYEGNEWVSPLSGWDFTPDTGVWKMGSDGYPHLAWEWNRTELATGL